MALELRIDETLQYEVKHEGIEALVRVPFIGEVHSGAPDGLRVDLNVNESEIEVLNLDGSEAEMAVQKRVVSVFDTNTAIRMEFINQLHELLGERIRNQAVETLTAITTDESFTPPVIATPNPLKEAQKEVLAPDEITKLLRLSDLPFPLWPIVRNLILIYIESGEDDEASFGQYTSALFEQHFDDEEDSRLHDCLCQFNRIRNYFLLRHDLDRYTSGINQSIAEANADHTINAYEILFQERQTLIDRLIERIEGIEGVVYFVEPIQLSTPPSGTLVNASFGVYSFNGAVLDRTLITIPIELDIYFLALIHGITNAIKFSALKGMDDYTIEFVMIEKVKDDDPDILEDAIVGTGNIDVWLYLKLGEDEDSQTITCPIVNASAEPITKEKVEAAFAQFEGKKVKDFGVRSVVVR